MEVEANITFDDILTFNMYHTMRSPMIRRQRYSGFLALPLVVLIGWLGVVFLGESPGERARAFWPFLMVPAGLFCYFVRFPATMQRRVEKFLREGANPGILGRRKYRLTDDGLVEEADTGHACTRWAAITRIEEADSAVYLYNSAVTAYVVPKRAFVSPQHLRDFVDEATRYMTLHIASLATTEQ